MGIEFSMGIFKVFRIKLKQKLLIADFQRIFKNAAISNTIKGN